MIAVILTGSAARNQAKFEMINGELCLVSDIDVVIVVRTKGLIKALIAVKKLSQIITDKLQKFRFRSNVSLSIMTYNSLATAPPSIFMFDLIHNGKIIYKNNDINLSFPRFSIDDIPNSDIYRLLFNRMVEALRSFLVNCIYTSFDETRNTRVLNSLEKLCLSIIQSILLKRQKLILYSKDPILTEIEGPEISEQDPLVFRYRHIIRKIEALKGSATVNKEEIENIWIELIGGFKSIVESLGFNQNRHLEFDLLFPRKSLSQKIVTCVLLFLQYYKISSFSDLMRTIIFESKFGSDHVYFIMYRLFLSSKKFISAPERGMNEHSLNAIDGSSEKWLSLFNSHMVIWKHKTGA